MAHLTIDCLSLFLAFYRFFLRTKIDVPKFIGHSSKSIHTIIIRPHKKVYTLKNLSHKH